jgi:adenosylcobinamide-phosphate synthase
VLGDARIALRCWKSQAPRWPSPNAGPLMAAGAGALGIVLGGGACYGGVFEPRPALGAGRLAVAADIGRAWRLVAATAALWIAAMAGVALPAYLGRP